MCVGYRHARGGPEAADHVSILGNRAVLEDTLRIAAGRGDLVEERIISEIDRIAANIEF
jgi:phospholipid:diacylglycerol acyltransferase